MSWLRTRTICSNGLTTVIELINQLLAIKVKEESQDSLDIVIIEVGHKKYVFFEKSDFDTWFGSE